MGVRFYKKRIAKTCLNRIFVPMWLKAGNGKYWKRRLSKARRNWRDEHKRGLSQIESDCNYKFY